MNGLTSCCILSKGGEEAGGCDEFTQAAEGVPPPDRSLIRGGGEATGVDGLEEKLLEVCVSVEYIYE